MELPKIAIAKRQTLTANGNERFELIGTLAPALMEAHLFVRLPVGHGPVPHERGVFGLTSFVLESHDHRHERLIRWLPSAGVSISKHEPLVLNNFEIDASIRKIVTLGIAHDDQVCAARAEVKLRDRCGIGERREPLLEELGIGPRLEHLLGRGVKPARDLQPMTP